MRNLRGLAMVAAAICVAGVGAGAAPARAVDLAPGVPVELPFTDESAGGVPEDSGTGGPGDAAANDAVAAECNWERPLYNPQWYTLPQQDLGLVNASQRAIYYPRGAETLPSGVAFVDRATREVVRCGGGPVRVTADRALAMVVYFADGEHIAEYCTEQEWCYTAELQVHLDTTTGFAPDNDRWQDARPITELPFSAEVDTTFADDDGPDLVDYGECLTSFVAPRQRATAWWRYRAPADMTVHADGVALLTDDGPVRAPREECWGPVRLRAGHTYLFAVYSTEDEYYSPDLAPGGRRVLTVEGVTAKAPTATAATTDGVQGAARLSWQPPADTGGSTVTGYLVTRDGQDTGGLAATEAQLPATARDYLFTGLRPWDTYSLSVRAVTAGGAGEEASRSVTVSLPTASAPRYVTATAERGATVVVRWHPPQHAGDSPIHRYRVSRFVGDATVPAASVVVPAGARDHTFTGLADQPHRFEVTALNAAGYGLPSARTPAVAPVVVPSAPNAVASSVAEEAKSARISWHPPADPGRLPVSGYVVSRDGQDAAGRGPVSARIPASARSWQFEGLRAGEPYTLAVKAVTGVGQGAPATARVVLTTPEPVRNLRALRGDRQLTVTWEPPARTGTSPIGSYDVSIGRGPEQVRQVRLPATARSHTFTGLQNGVEYAMRVSPVNDSGADPGREVAELRPGTVPTAAGIGPATPGTPGGPVTATATWTGPASNGGLQVTGWRLTALRMSATGSVLGSTVAIRPAAERAHEFALPEPGAYRFTVEALNEAGPGAASPRSNAVEGR